MARTKALNVFKRRLVIVVAIALFATTTGCDGEGDPSAVADDPPIGWPVATPRPWIAAPRATPTATELMLQTIRERGLTGEYVEAETLSFIEQVAEDPETAVETLVVGVVALLVVVLDDNTPFEHKVEVLGETFVPFWACVRPVVGGPLFDPESFDLGRIDWSACEQEVLETLLLATAARFAGRVAIAGQKLHNLRFTPHEAEEFVSTAGDLHSWTSSIYERGIVRDRPLIAQLDHLPAVRDYERFASPSFFDSTTPLPERFDIARFRGATQQYRTPGFTIPYSLHVAAATSG